MRETIGAIVFVGFATTDMLNWSDLAELVRSSDLDVTRQDKTGRGGGVEMTGRRLGSVLILIPIRGDVQNLWWKI